MLSRAVVVTMIGSFSAFAAFARPTTLCFELCDRVVTHSGHEADLVINEDRSAPFSDVSGS